MDVKKTSAKLRLETLCVRDIVPCNKDSRGKTKKMRKQINFCSKNRGFTLIELSIVIVIIALIIGGIVIGQHLVNSFKVMRIASEYQKYASITNTFRIKFNALPGDMSNAQSVFGSTACPNNGGSNLCNGNGDGTIELAGTIYSGESPRVWQHLALSQLLDTSYSGGNPSGYCDTLTTSCPTSAYTQNAYWGIATNITSNSYFVMDSNTTYFMLARNLDGQTSIAFRFFGVASTIRSIDAFSVDLKLDDGNPFTGKVRAGNYDTTDTVSGSPWAAQNRYCTKTNGTYYTGYNGMEYGCKLAIKYQ